MMSLLLALSAIFLIPQCPLSGEKEPELYAINWDEYKVDILTLALKIHQSEEKPDSIICICRGGALVGEALSRISKLPVGYIIASSYVGEKGREQKELKIASHISSLHEIKGHILLVDELADSGTTLAQVKKRLMQNPEVLSVKTAAVYIKSDTRIIPDYHGKTFDKRIWLEFPNEIFDKMSLETHQIQGLSDEKLQILARDICN